VLNASRPTVVGLILAATVLFVVGILLEKGSESDHHSESVAFGAETAAEHAAESGESPAHVATESPDAHADEAGSEEAKPSGGTPAEQAGEAGRETHNESGEAHSESGEKVLGISYESTPFVILAVLASLGMAAAVWLARAPWIFLLVAAAMIAFAVFDIAEVFHQVDRSEGGIAALAGLVAALHLAAGLGSSQLRRQPTAS
jgi:hypothetical protein